jgi:hypothetical protein
MHRGQVAFEHAGRVINADSEDEHRKNEAGAHRPTHHGKVSRTSGRIWPHSGKTTLCPAVNPSDV